YRLCAGAVTGRISLEGRNVDDRHLRDEGLELFLRRTDQEIADEQRMPGVLGDDADRQLVLRIGAAAQILYEEVHVCRMLQHVLVEDLEVLRRKRLVVVPPDVVLRQIIANDELVLRRTAGVLAGRGHQRAMSRQPGLA